MINLLENCVSIDIETTGIYPDKHAMIEIGVCNFKNDDELFVELAIPHMAEITDRALEINGHKRELLRDRITLGGYLSIVAALQEVHRYCSVNEVSVLVGKNPSFDYGFLEYNWKQTFGLLDLPFFLSHRLLDYGTMAIPLMLKAGELIPANGFSSTDVQSFLGLDPEPTPHNGLTGARYNVMCVKEILQRYKKL